MTKSEQVISVFGVDDVTKITGLSERQLAYWDRTGFFKPQYASVGAGKSPVRIYFFRDLVSLRTLRVLKEEHRVSLQHLRTVLKDLSAYSDAPFAELKLKVYNREVHVTEPGTDRTRGVVSGQYVLLPLINVIQDVRRAAANLGVRSAEDYGKTEQRRNVSHNARVIAGTRIPVRAIRRFIAAGYSAKQIMFEYPSLTAEDIEAVAAENVAQVA